MSTTAKLRGAILECEREITRDALLNLAACSKAVGEELKDNTPSEELLGLQKRADALAKTVIDKANEVIADEAKSKRKKRKETPTEDDGAPPIF